jgi:hypothetical protein
LHGQHFETRNQGKDEALDWLLWYIYDCSGRISSVGIANSTRHYASICRRWHHREHIYGCIPSARSSSLASKTADPGGSATSIN